MPTEISGSTGVNKIQDNTIVNADINSSAAIAGSELVMPTGSVLQVVQGSSTTSTSTSSTSYVDTGLSATITPSSTSSKILISATFSFDNNTVGGQPYLAFYRGTDNLNGAASANAWGTNYAASRLITQISGQQLNSPSSTSALTYSVKFKSAGGETIEFTSQGTVSYITLMEIAG